jgi:hypothetical protein
MKKIILLIIPALTFMAACQKEVPVGDERTVEIKISTGTTIGAATRADDMDDDTIGTVDILIFNSKDLEPEAATFEYTRYAWKKSGSSDLYNAILKTGGDLDIYFAINARKAIEEAALTVGETFASVKSKLKLTGAIDRAADGLPMWGYRHGVTLSESANNNFGTIKVLRAVSTAEIYITATNFSLLSGSVEYTSSQGSLAYSVGNIEFSTGDTPTAPSLDYQLKSPEVPAGTTTDGSIGYTLIPTDTKNQIADKFYFYENDKDETTATAAKRYTKMVIAGKWNNNTPEDATDDVVSYYPLAFRDKEATAGSNPRVSIIRNTKFVFRITNVNGKGYPSLEDAKQGEDLNMEYDVIEWNEWEEGDIVMVEGMWISVGKSRNEEARSGGQMKTASLWRNVTSTDQIDFTTNIDFTELELLLDDGVVDEDLTDETLVVNGTITGKIANDYYEVYLVKGRSETVDGEVKTHGSLVFVAKQLYADRTPSVLTINSDLIKYSINIVQRNSSPQDWIDGGDQGVTLK